MPTLRLKFVKDWSRNANTPQKYIQLVNYLWNFGKDCIMMKNSRCAIDNNKDLAFLILFNFILYNIL